MWSRSTARSRSQRSARDEAPSFGLVIFPPPRQPAAPAGAKV